MSAFVEGKAFQPSRVTKIGKSFLAVIRNSLSPSSILKKIMKWRPATQGNDIYDYFNVARLRCAMSKSVFIVGLLK